MLMVHMHHASTLSDGAGWPMGKPWFVRNHRLTIHDPLRETSFFDCLSFDTNDKVSHQWHTHLHWHPVLIWLLCEVQLCPWTCHGEFSLCKWTINLTANTLLLSCCPCEPNNGLPKATWKWILWPLPKGEWWEWQWSPQFCGLVIIDGIWLPILFLSENCLPSPSHFLPSSLLFALYIPPFSMQQYWPGDCFQFQGIRQPMHNLHHYHHYVHLSIWAWIIHCS